MGKGIVKLGEGNWAVKDGNLLAAKETNGRFKNAEFTVTRGTDATYVGKDGLIANETGDNTPRIDFTENTDGHLLLEPQSTNLVTYSENFNETETDWSFANGGTGSDPVETKENISSPNGYLGVSKIVFNGGEGTTSSDWSFITQSYTSAADDFTTSIYLKGENGGEKIFVDSNNGNDNIVTLTTSWQRYEITRTHTTTDTKSIRIGLRGGTGSDMSETTVYAWGAKHEKLPYATSYIPTNGSTVTRDGETCTGSGESADFNSSEGVLYAEIAALANDGVAREITLNDGTEDNRVIISYNISNQIRINYRKSGSNIFDQTHTTTITDYNKIAIKWELNSFRFYVNGTQIASSSSGAVMSANTLNTIDFDNYTGSFKFNGKCKAIRVYKEALSDGELTTLTS